MCVCCSFCCCPMSLGWPWLMQVGWSCTFGQEIFQTRLLSMNLHWLKGCTVHNLFIAVSNQTQKNNASTRE